MIQLKRSKRQRTSPAQRLQVIELKLKHWSATPTSCRVKVSLSKAKTSKSQSWLSVNFSWMLLHWAFSWEPWHGQHQSVRAWNERSSVFNMHCFVHWHYIRKAVQIVQSLLIKYSKLFKFKCWICPGYSNTLIAYPENSLMPSLINLWQHKTPPLYFLEVNICCSLWSQQPEKQVKH